MRKALLFFFLAFLILRGLGQQVPNCNNWLATPDYGSAVNIGQLNIPGTQLTVEAEFYQTAYNSTQSMFGSADLVGKYEDPSNDNYLLRADYCSITTDHGFFQTPAVTGRQLNKNYQVAMVYDGDSLKYYQNGCEVSSIAATGNLVQNSFDTRIGFYAYQYWDVQFYGYINEVRIWNIARTAAQIKAYTNSSLPNPATQTGLLAYYTFDNLLNKQGNASWDGTLAGAAAINQTDPSCSFVANSCEIPSSTVTASFNGPDTVCVNTPVTFQNTSQNATNYFWSFCAAGFDSIPEAVNLGNPNGVFSTPVFGCYELDDNGNYYGLLINYTAGDLVRLNFGNSLLNTPTGENLGNFGGALPEQAEGIQLLRVNGNWTAILVGGGNGTTNSSPRVVKIDFGNSLANTPVATNWGNIGGLNFPHDFYITQEAGNYYGFAININDNTLTRINFGPDFNSTPTGVNLGNIGNLSYPAGFTFIKYNGNWYAYIADRVTNSITRLDFGTSLLNTPTGTNLGNPGNFLQRPRDISLFNSCDGIYGFVVNEGNNEIVKLNFGNDPTTNPQATDLGNIGNLDFPHSISDLFRVGNDIYAFIPNAYGNSLTRIRFKGCQNIPGSDQKDPPPISYPQPGTYNVNLLVDLGLPTQTSYCKQIVVTSIDSMKINDSITSCTSVDFRGLGYTTMSGITSWNWDFGDGSKDSIQNTSHTYSSPGTYNVKLIITNNSGCQDSITTQVTVTSIAVATNNDTAVCAKSSVQLFASGGTSYSWSPASTLSNPNIANPIATPTGTTTYFVTVSNGMGCTNKDSVKITINSLPVITKSKDTGVCNNTPVQLYASGGTSYSWSPAASLNNPNSSNPIATPPTSATTVYHVTVTDNNGCSDTDSVKVTTSAPPTITKTSDQNICNGTTLQLFATGGGTYQWSPASSLSNAAIANPVASPAANTKYYITVTNTQGCAKTDSVQIGIYPVANIMISSDTSICTNTSVQLFASGGSSYLWSPASSLNNANSATPIATPAANTTYHVAIRDLYNCDYKDSVTVDIIPPAVFAVSPGASVCLQNSTQLTASGGDTYTWAPPDGLSDPNIANPTASPTATTTYTVRIHANACNETSDLSTTVTVFPLPQVTALSANDLTCSIGSSQLTANGAATYLWTPSTSLNNSSISNPVASPEATTLYTVTGTDANGCANTDTVTVNVDFSKNALYLLPNSFTPNGDGLNDCFGVKYWGVVHDLDFRIYNRFGQMVFHTTDPNACWNGTYNGRLQEPAVFVYVIKASTACGVVNRKGTVTLLR